MSAFVVDTNVPVVANGRAEHADPECVLTCLAALEEVKTSGIIVLDDKGRILREYMDHLSLSGQPGAGDAFMKWVWSVQAVSELCEQVAIRPRHADQNDFVEFPNDPALVRFDRNDRKFVAVALASNNDPIVLNAVDSDWATHHPSLVRRGVKVRFLCPQHVCPTL